ncbi:helix-turn-helix domain-containing protein [Streptomyces acidiscabies]|uniref:helix-turn-helix domain-containing protein n=1 Tax=Streptomyces acidiscabies TaxID=42234 RepID=UPI00117BF161|nr:helix-turn-helix domain-containing protein [Streptomyces acidiscabies]
MPKQKKPPTSTPQGYALTINQVVSYNLGRARRSRGWTQEETASRLEAASGKKWTAATLSASERAIATNRPRVFDANELIAFSRVFEYPVGYFLLPVEPKAGEGSEHFFYLLSRLGEEGGHQSEPVMDMTDLLYSVFPLRYPAAVIDTVNRLLSFKGIAWSPDARVEWSGLDDADYETSSYLDHKYGDAAVSLDDWKTVVDFASLAKRMPAAKVLRLVADAMEQPPQTDSEEPREPLPF